MGETYVVRANKIVTAGPLGIIEQGALVVEDGILLRVISEGELSSEERSLPFADFGELTLTPALADCHCHLLEYAAGSLYPVAEPAHLLAGKALLLNALCSGVTALGEQICGHPACDLSVGEYRQAVEGLPLTVRFALCGITLGTEGAPHYSALTGSTPVGKSDLLSPKLLGDLVEGNDYPGENVFLNATPANLPLSLTPQAGELVFRREELLQIVKEYHRQGKRVGVHVGRASRWPWTARWMSFITPMASHPPKCGRQPSKGPWWWPPPWGEPTFPPTSQRRFYPSWKPVWRSPSPPTLTCPLRRGWAFPPESSTEPKA